MSEQQQAQQQAATSEAGAQRTLTGTVVSSKMQKTVSVSVKHERYSKYIRRTTQLLAHDEASECKEGDLVEIAECRRLSARKAWKVVRVVKRAGTV